MKKLLIGGAALQELGSTRHTMDVNYLICDPESDELFLKSDTGDIINAAAHPFFKALWESESQNIGPIASPQTLLELKVFALVQHVRNGFWQKADDAEYDIRFIVRNFGVTQFPLATEYLNAGEISEVKKVIEDTRK